jgi:putative transcription factor
MHCELCGSVITGSSGKRVRIEGAELEVCGQCAKYGVELQQPKKPALKRKVPGAPATPVVHHRRDAFDMMDGEIVDDYGERIKNARSERGMSQKDLALAVKEREILIKKIEKGDLIPEDEVRKKIEKVLQIRLVDSPEDPIEKRRSEQVKTTLGDLISIKRHP